MDSSDDSLKRIDWLEDKLSLSQSAIYDKLKDIPHYKVFGSIRFKPSEIDWWLSMECKQGPAVPHLG